jgi:SAM-dependent methyltransferase
MAEAEIAGYYDRLTRWNSIARVFGYGGGFDTWTVHRAIADPSAGGRATSTRLHDVLVQALPPLRQPVVLDAGCGLGGTMIDLARRLLPGRYVGITLSPRQAEIGQRAIEQCGLTGHVSIVAGSYDEPPAGPFNLILAIESLAHSSHPAASLSALARVLAPGGIIAIVDDMPARGSRESDDFQVFASGWQCGTMLGPAEYHQTLEALGLDPYLDVDLTPACRPRTIRWSRWLERLNRVARRMVPVASWRALMDTHRGGLALERLLRDGFVEYRLIVARAPARR